MYGLTRATTTLIAAFVAGLLLWFATQVSNDELGGYWARIGLIAGAGLVMALSQLLGGWTKWGWPRLSVPVFLTAFVPVALVSLWVILAGEPGNGWFHSHVLDWSRDIGVSGLVTDLTEVIAVLAFGTGLVFGFTFDTTGPRRYDDDLVETGDRRGGFLRRRRAAATTDDDVADDRRGGFFRRRRRVATTDDRVADEPLTADREDRRVVTDDREPVTTTRRTNRDN